MYIEVYMIQRTKADKIRFELNKGKSIIITGARQTGKTSLLSMLFEKKDSVLFLNGDNFDIQEMFKTITAERLLAFLGNKKTLVIDEAQRIKDIGLRLKLIADQLPDIQLVATGSSSFELANMVNEPLTGRKREFKLYPLSFAELVNEFGLLTEKRMLPHRLVYGSYPELVVNQGNEKTILKEISESYLYKDILSWEQIQKPEKLTRLLQALALQIGSQVSYSELASLCGIDSKTVEKYITVLEQTYIIFRLSSFNRNARNELKNSRKIYFYDNGIRNAILANFAPIEIRQDSGVLWENYIISERKKFLDDNQKWVNSYFWRTKEQKEIDLIEESDGMLSAFECKYSNDFERNEMYKNNTKIPLAFSNAYPYSQFKVITPNNVEEFLL